MYNTTIGDSKQLSFHVLVTHSIRYYWFIEMTIDKTIFYFTIDKNKIILHIINMERMYKGASISAFSHQIQGELPAINLRTPPSILAKF